MKDLEIGCIGCGFIADIHLRNARLMPGIHIRAVADIREQAARSFYERYQPAYWTTDSRRLLEDRALDAILICTYHASHAELAVAVARTGKHVFLEKPMATSSAECLEVIRACEATGVKLALDLKFRFSAAALEVKRAIQKPVIVVSQASMDEISEDDFQMDSLNSAIVQDLGAHSLDLACFLAGSEPIRIFAKGSRLPHRRTNILDAVVGTVEFESGCVASFLISDCAEWPYPSKWFLEVADGRRNAVIHNHCRTAVLAGDLETSMDQSHIPPHEIGSFEALADFFDAIRDNRAPKVGAKDGIRFALLSESLLESIRCGKSADITSPDGGEFWYKCAYANGRD